ncbi:hypothetical protein D050_4253B, partial [Vibrio parahaemolyticus VPCR-2009]
YLEA